MRRPKTHVLALSVLPLLLCAASGCTLATLLRQRERGGVYIVLAVRADSAQLYQSVEQTMAVMRSRCDGLAVVCNVERQGGEWSNRIMLRVSGATDTARLKRVLLAEGRLEFRPVVSPPSPVPVQTYTTREKAAAAAGKDNDVLPYT